MGKVVASYFTLGTLREQLLEMGDTDTKIILIGPLVSP